MPERDAGIALDAETGAAPLSRWPDRPTLFTGELQFACDDSSATAFSSVLEGTIEHVQWLVSAAEGAVSGPFLTVTNDVVNELSGVTSGDEVVLLDAKLDAAGRSVRVASMRLALRDGVISGSGDAAITGVAGDILTDCNGAAALHLAADTLGLEVLPGAYTVAGILPLRIELTEAAQPGLRVEVTHAGEALEVEVELDLLGEYVRAVQIVPSYAWPASGVSVRIDALRDAGGNAGQPVERSLDAVAWRSATGDASFENTQDDSPWLGCERVERFDYMDWGAGRERSFAPSDGTRMAQCRDNGALMQAYVEPPAGASRMRLDLAYVDVSTGRSEGSVLQLELRYPDGEEDVSIVVELDAASPDGLQSLEVELASDAPYWLVASMDGGTFEEGTPATVTLFDHLRFE